jgi:hypothetical protein
MLVLHRVATLRVGPAATLVATLLVGPAATLVATLLVGPGFPLLADPGPSGPRSLVMGFTVVWVVLVGTPLGRREEAWWGLWAFPVLWWGLWSAPPGRPGPRADRMWPLTTASGASLPLLRPLLRLRRWPPGHRRYLLL